MKMHIWTLELDKESQQDHSEKLPHSRANNVDSRLNRFRADWKTSRDRKSSSRRIGNNLFSFADMSSQAPWARCEFATHRKLTKNLKGNGLERLTLQVTFFRAPRSEEHRYKRNVR